MSEAIEQKTIVTIAAIGIVAIGAVYLIKKAATAAAAAGGAAVNAAGGLITGNNPITAGATDASGNPTTAYQGAGVLGTVGAATNAASGGMLASIGSWIGTTAYDLTHATTNPASSPGTAAPGTTTSAPTAHYDAMGNYLGTY